MPKRLPLSLNSSVYTLPFINRPSSGRGRSSPLSSVRPVHGQSHNDHFYDFSTHGIFLDSSRITDASDDHGLVTCYSTFNIVSCFSSRCFHSGVTTTMPPSTTYAVAVSSITLSYTTSYALPHSLSLFSHVLLDLAWRCLEFWKGDALLF